MGDGGGGVRTFTPGTINLIIIIIIIIVIIITII